MKNIKKWIISCDTSDISLGQISVKLQNLGFTDIKILDTIKVITASGTDHDANDATKYISGIISIDENGPINTIKY